jgi:hypothetical protein
MKGETMQDPQALLMKRTFDVLEELLTPQPTPQPAVELVEAAEELDSDCYFDWEGPKNGRYSR